MPESKTRKKPAAKKTAAKRAPAKKAQSKPQPDAPLQVSSIKDFKSKKQQGTLLALPSGLIVRAQRVELRSFINKGDIPNALMQIVQETLDKGKNIDLEKLVGDGEKIDLDMVNDMYEAVDHVVCEVLLQPKCFPVPDDETQRDDDLLYVDEVDDEDKMFLYQWSSGGTADLEQFRKEADAAMASVAEIQGGRGKAKRPAGRK